MWNSSMFSSFVEGRDYSWLSVKAMSCFICIDLCFLFYIWAFQSEVELQLQFTCWLMVQQPQKPVKQATMTWRNDEQLSPPNWLSQAQYPNSLGGTCFLFGFNNGSPMSTHCLEGRWYQIIITKRNQPLQKRLQQHFPGFEKKEVSLMGNFTR